ARARRGGQRRRLRLESTALARPPAAQGNGRRSRAPGRHARSVAHQPRPSGGARNGFSGGGPMSTLAVAAERLEVKQQPTPQAPPATIADTGLHPDTLSQLMLKTLVASEMSGTQLAEGRRLPYSVLDAMLQHARVEKLIEVRGAGGAGNAGYRYALTDLGRDRAMQFLDLNRYVGPAPVPLSQYSAYVRASMAARPWIDRDILAKGFSEL